jgi:uncharacterized membrane protein YbhN (UPF0104 family)
MRVTGVPTSWIMRRASGLFFLTSAVSVAALVVAGLVALPAAGGPAELARDGLPVLGGLAAAALLLALPRLADSGRRRRSVRDLLEGIRDARDALRRPSWRLLGAAGYLMFDIAVLWCTLKALGAGPPVAALVLGYTIGYLANSLPVPGGLGVLDAGLAAALILYRVPVEHVAAAVLVYHAIALWLPGLGGVLAYARFRRRV